MLIILSREATTICLDHRGKSSQGTYLFGLKVTKLTVLTLEWHICVPLMCDVYFVLRYGEAHCYKVDVSERWRVTESGFLPFPAMLIWQPRTRSDECSVVDYCVLLCHCQHVNFLLFILSCCSVVYSHLIFPRLLSKSYPRLKRKKRSYFAHQFQD